MSGILSWLSANAVALGALGTAGTFVWSVLQFAFVRRREQRAHEFEAYHRLIRELVSPDGTNGSMWIDRQIAAIFELRHFPRYFEVTKRILVGLREKWSIDPASTWARLLHEVDLTLQYVQCKKPNKSLERSRDR